MKMKKLILILALAMFAAPAFSQTCQMGVAWTPDPLGAPTVTEQRIYLDADSTDGNGTDALVGTVGPTATQHQWSLAQACYSNDRVYITTVYLGGLTKASAKVAVQSVVGAVIQISIRDNQP